MPSAILATGFVMLSAISLQSGLVLDTIVKANREKYELELIKYEKGEKSYVNRFTYA